MVHSLSARRSRNYFPSFIQSHRERASAQTKGDPVKLWIFPIAMLVALAGCSSGYAMKDIKIVNANDKLGHDVVAVCDTCKEHSICGSRDDSVIWADQHARATGHTHFTRQACSTGLTPVVRGPEEHVPPKANPADNAATVEAWKSDDVLKPGMTIAEARTAMGDVGHTDSETMANSVARRTISFRQAGHGANANSSRTVTVDFENGRLTATRYGDWGK